MSLVSRHRAGIALGIGLLVLPLLVDPWSGSDLPVKRLWLSVTAAAMCALWYALPRPGPNPLLLPATAYVAWNALSLLWAANPFAAAVELAQLVTVFLLFVAMTGTLDLEDVLVAPRFASVGALLVAVTGICQYLGLGFESLPSVGHPSGTFTFRNLAAAYIVGVFPLCALAVISDGSSRRWLWVVTGAALGLLLIYTRTRGAWVAFAAALAIAAVLCAVSPQLRSLLADWVRSTRTPSWRRPAIAAGILVFCLAAFAPANTSRGVIQRFDEQKTSALATAKSVFHAGSDRGRFAFWSHTVAMIADHPFLGVGLDNWEFAYPPYDGGDRITSASEPVRPHNDVLWIASELGLIGLALFAWLLLSAARAVRDALRTRESLTLAVAVASTTGLVAILVHGLVSFPKEQPATAALFWVHLACLALAARRARTDSAPAARDAKGFPVAGIAVCVLAVGLGYRHVRFERHFSAATTLSRTGQKTSALAHAESALELGPFDHRAAFLEGRILQDLGRVDEAETAYRRALEYHPNYAHSYHNLGGLYETKRDIPAAVAAYERAIRIRPTYTEARVHLGNLLLRAGQTSAARKQFDAILDYSPRYAEAHSTLGAIALQSGNLPAAVTSLERAVGIKPNLAQAWNNLGFAYEKSGRLMEAIAAYENVVRYWSGDPQYADDVRAHIASLRASLPGS